MWAGGHLPRRTHRGLGAALEVVWNGAHALTWPVQVPLRLLGSSGSALSLADPAPDGEHPLVVPRQGAGDTEPDRPVVLVHGIGDNPSLFPAVRAELARRGHDHVVAVDYSPERDDVRAVAADLGRHVEALAGSRGVDVVAHSLGGLIARYYVQRLGGHEHVRTLATAGTPHHGTRTAHLLPTRLGRQLRPRSDLYAELDEPAPGVRTRFVCLASGIDHVILPRTSSLLAHPDLPAEHTVLPDIGHMSLAIHPASVGLLADAVADGA
ncbi:esterase/lipase family protein [Aquipuribacter sp. SD81]|uniref:esterase/lipase family protein n=1 Tax=Aquipuribacter sp. SD81 TaxID=3127703 RepID=UPI003015EF34